MFCRFVWTRVDVCFDCFFLYFNNLCILFVAACLIFWISVVVLKTFLVLLEVGVRKYLVIVFNVDFVVVYLIRV